MGVSDDAALVRLARDGDAVLATVDRSAPPADIRPHEWRPDSLRRGSLGSAEIVAEVRETWRPEGWKQKKDVPRSSD